MSGIRILVVDEEDKLRETVSRTLSSDGHEVTQIASGKKAIDAFRKHPFPLVISDIEMKNMSGIELLQEVKQLHPDSEVILMTNHPSMETAIAALRHEACDYIMKAYDSLDLITSAVNRAVKKVQHSEEHRRLLDLLTKQNEELEHSWRTFKEAAAHDELTGLFNLRYFHEALDVEVNRSSHFKRNLSLVFVDVKFNQRNNLSTGTEEKTRLLCIVAQIVNNRLRKSDLLARYQDETFAILLPETSGDGTQCVIDGIRQLLSENPLLSREALPAGNITFSMRTAVYPEDGVDGTALIRNTTPVLERPM